MDSTGGEDDVRRWLDLLHQPDLLAQTNILDVLHGLGRLTPDKIGLDASRDAVSLLIDSIERLRPVRTAKREETLPYQVLHTCFVSGVKHAKAAEQLGMSSRSLTRWRVRAIKLLASELLQPMMPAAGAYRPSPIPAILDFQPRPAVATRLRQGLATDHYVHVHGPKGIGKTCLVAELAVELQAATPVLWYRFRTGLSDSAGTLLFEIAEYMRSRGRNQAAAAFARSAPVIDVGPASRLVLRDLSEAPLLLVLDDYHLGESDPAISGFLDDAVPRLPDLRVITIGRHSNPPGGVGVSCAIPPMSRVETERLLVLAGVRGDPVMIDSIRRWTAGIPQLIKLAGTWLSTANPSEVTKGLKAFTEREEVQNFLVGSIAELMDTSDRAVLDAASVFRAHFNDSALAYVADSSIGAVGDTSARLVRTHVAARSRAGDVAFFHTSIREYFYKRLDPAQRARLHRRAEDWYQRHGNLNEARYHERTAARTGRGSVPPFGKE